MKIGVCGGTDRIAATADAGFDYIEGNFTSITRWTDEEYFNFNNELKKYSLPCEAANCFLPGDMKIVGDSVDYKALEEYLLKGFARAKETGIKMVVMGSGGARSVPDGFSFQKAVNQIVFFVSQYAAPIAADNGIDFVFEPLCKPESNIINTIKDGAMLASVINMPNVGTLGDLYHMHVEGDTYKDVRDLKGIFRHAHISYPVPCNDMKRVFMKSPDEYDYKGFFEALKFAGCERVSIEAATKDFNSDVYPAAEIMKMYK
ncbi:MAG: sugar phosphate isomerase/epimerase [Clostridia bacterium]|nr:sugar phosphate isomerase/epimerase [Clostridia bacterium]